MRVVDDRSSVISGYSLAVVVIFAVTTATISYLGDVTFRAPPNFPLLIVGVLVLDLLFSLQAESHITASLRQMIYGLLFLVTMCTYGAMTAYVTQRLGFPLRDAMFVASDRAMGIDWHALVSWVDRHPTINSMLGFAYGTIGFQLASPIVIFAWLGRADRLRLYLLSVSIALAVTDVIAMLLPAASHIASIDTTAFQIVQFSGATPLQHLAMLRSPDPVVIPGSLGGLLAFPSFHAAVAVLVPFMLRHVKWVFPLSLLINAAMFASAITEGAHYVCDTLAGALVAGVAYLAAKRLLSKQTIRANRPAAAFETSHGAQATT